ncbi:MAG: MBL fold metallo-hydrolase [Clostridiales bacterium]|jgi:L-ascorbate metabolism protein UlaG (beta-lactamase superfamily)|nr:MBL fold metallo-hydrolase [Clostridiales bacterium]
MRDEWKSAAIENYRISYKGLWQNMFQQIHSKDYDHHMWLLGPSSYIFSTNGLRWGIDIQFRFPWIADSLGDLLAEDLSKLDVIMLTHEHSDHLDYSLLSLLRDAPVKWLIPAFFNREKLLETGLPSHRITWVEPGRIYEFEGLSVKAFNSLHFRPNNGSGVPEMGYMIDTGRINALFPVDVRDYDASKMPEFEQIDCLFTHVWLGDANALNLPCEPFLTRICDFSIALNPKRIYLTHLYEIGRPITDMWTYTHAGLVADGLLARNPALDILVPRIGRAYSLLT